MAGRPSLSLEARDAAPADPPPGRVLLYADDAGDVHVLDSSGTDTTLGAGGGGGAVSSVYGRTGAVVAASGDYDATQIDMSASSRILGRATAGAGAVEELTGAQATALLDAASTTARGIVELATDAETQTGTDAARAVTPASGAASWIKRDVLTTAGDLLTASGASTPARLGIGAEGAVLGVESGALAWSPLLTRQRRNKVEFGTVADLVANPPTGTAWANSGAISSASSTGGTAALAHGSSSTVAWNGGSAINAPTLYAEIVRDDSQYEVVVRAKSQCNQASEAWQLGALTTGNVYVFGVVIGYYAGLAPGIIGYNTAGTSVGSASLTAQQVNTDGVWVKVTCNAAGTVTYWYSTSTSSTPPTTWTRLGSFSAAAADVTSLRRWGLSMVNHLNPGGGYSMDILYMALPRSET